MNKLHIYTTESLVLKWIEVMPEDGCGMIPQPALFSTDKKWEIRYNQWSKCQHKYNSALSKAKREAKTPFEDQDYALMMLCAELWDDDYKDNKQYFYDVWKMGGMLRAAWMEKIEKDKIYSIDYSGRVEIINSRFAKDDLPVGIPVARLIPESTEVESQEELSPTDPKALDVYKLDVQALRATVTDAEFRRKLYRMLNR
jgi:hypothetical protein